MFKSKLFISLCAVVAFAAVCLAGKSIFYSPQGATPVAASGLPKLEVGPDPSFNANALQITATSTIASGDPSQSVMIPLNGLVSNTKLKGIRVSYLVEATTPGTTYAMVRLTQMNTNFVSSVIEDDTSVLSNTTVSVHTTSISAPFWKIRGPITLDLRCIFADTSDVIHVAGVEVLE